MRFLKTALLASLILLCSTAGASAQAINDLRQQQAQELQALQAEYGSRAQGLEGAEYDDLLEEYSHRRQEIQQRYKAQDTRSRDIADVQRRFDGDIVNTGSAPKNVDADVDLAAQSDAAADRLQQEWRDQGHEVVDSGYKIENTTTDTVLWRPETPERRQAMAGDYDAYQTTGGRKSTGNVRDPSSFSGAGLDPTRKMVHADITGDSKTFGKGFAKLYEQAYGAQTFEKDPATGKVRETKVLPDGGGPTYDKCKRLQNYGDPYEADIFKLGDPPDVQQQKWEAFRQEVYQQAGQAQNALDKRFTRQVEALEALEQSVADPEMKKRIRERIDSRVESNRVAREDIGNMLRTQADVDADLFEIRSEPPVRAAGTTDGDATGPKADGDGASTKSADADTRTKSAGADGPAHGPVARGGKLARLRSGAMNAADWLVTAYEFNETVKQTEEQAARGEHEFIEIDEDDSPTVRNAKVYGWALFESTPAGGGFSAGRQADEAEKQRILEAIRRGESVNPLVSWLRATGDSFYTMAYGMTVGVLEKTGEALGEAAFEATQLQETAERNERLVEEQEAAQKELEQKKAALEEKRAREVAIESIVVTPSAEDKTHHAAMEAKDTPIVFVRYRAGAAVQSVAAHLRAVDAAGATLSEVRATRTPENGADVIGWKAGAWAQQNDAVTRFVVTLTPTIATGETLDPVSDSVQIVCEAAYEKPSITMRATKGTYDGPALSEPVGEEDIVAIQATITPRAQGAVPSTVDWRVLRPDGSLIPTLAKREQATLAGQAVTSRMRFKVKSMAPGRYTVAVAVQPEDDALPKAQGSMSFTVGQSASIERLVVTPSPDSQSHHAQLDSGATPHFYLYYNLPANVPSASVQLQIKNSRSGETLTSRSVTRERKGNNPQRVGLRMEQGVYPENTPLQFAVAVTPKGGATMTRAADFSIRESPLAIRGPQALDAGQSEHFSIHVPKGLRPPYSVDIEVSGPVAVGAERNALEGVVSGLDKSGTGVVRVTLTDADGRVLSGTKKITVQGKPQVAKQPTSPAPSTTASRPAQPAGDPYQIGLQRWRKAAIAHINGVIIPCARTSQFNSFMAGLRSHTPERNEVLAWGRANSSQLASLNKKLGVYMLQQAEKLVPWWPNTACFRQTVARMAQAAVRVGRTSNAAAYQRSLQAKLAGPQR